MRPLGQAASGYTASAIDIVGSTRHPCAMRILMIGALGYFVAIIMSRRIASGAMAALEPTQKVALMDHYSRYGRRISIPFLLVVVGFASLAWWPRDFVLPGWRIFCVLFVGLLLARGVQSLRRMESLALPAAFLNAQRRALTVLALGSASLVAGALLAFR
jgi:hypothetical protein